MFAYDENRKRDGFEFEAEYELIGNFYSLSKFKDRFYNYKEEKRRKKNNRIGIAF